MPEGGLYETALAGLLHDIGKFLQRRGIAKHHAEVARENQEWFKSKNVSGIDFAKIISAVSHHHNPSDPFEQIICMADGLSASERDGDKDYKPQQPLASIFEQIKPLGGSHGKKVQDYSYPIRPLSDELPYPHSPEERDDSTKADYRKSIEKNNGLLDELASLKERQHSKGAYFDSMFTLIKKYTALVPSSTDTPADISLFEHLKTTAAIACALSQYKEQAGTLPDGKDKAFLLIGFELSGIQEFIYTIRTENAAKSLRGRSFYVKLMSLVIERYLLDELGLLAPNIVMSGGGRSYLLAANTDKTRRTLEAAKKSIQKYMISEFKGRLGASLEWIEFNGNEFSTRKVNDESEVKDVEKGSFADVKNRLDEKLRDAKSRKFIGVLEDYFGLEDGNSDACTLCNGENNSGTDICEKCRLFIDIGTERIRSNKHFIETHENSDINFQIGERAYYFTFADGDDVLNAKKIYVRRMEDTVELLKKTDAAIVFMPYPIVGAITDFEALANGSEGIARLGYLKLDVDNLGRIFSEGLGSHATICRVSTLSFLTDYFFTCGVEEISKRFENLYLVYSGGDDLFLVGAWNEAILCSTKIRAEFGRWACGNKSVGLSAGLSFSKDGFPIYVSAEFAKDALDRSKTGVKDKITAFADSLGWDHFNDLLELGNYLSDCLKSKKISMSLLYSFLLLKKQYLIRRSLAFARTDYALARNVKDDQTYARLKREIHKNLPYIETPAQYAAWLNRNNAKEVIGG